MVGNIKEDITQFPRMHLLNSICCYQVQFFAFVFWDIIINDFPNTRMNKTNLTSADLTGANLRYAILERARIDGAKLEGTDVTGTDREKELGGDTFDSSYVMVRRRRRLKKQRGG